MKTENKSEIFTDFFFGVKKLKFANLPKRALPKFRGDRSEVRGVNRRSKFAVAAVDVCGGIFTETPLSL